MAKQQAWEYQVLEEDPRSISATRVSDRTLRTMGEQYWELVSIHPLATGATKWVFKRPAADER